MSHPFQCTAVVPHSSKGEDILLAACGSRLLALGIRSKKLFSQWSSQKSSSDQTEYVEDAERPAKKQKVGNSLADSPVIIKLEVSSSGKYAIAVTDDKILRVFQIEENGSIDELNQRCMPKRPCAIAILPDNSTILCGDKFGDVYSLPLHPDKSERIKAPSDPENGARPEEKNYKPAATNLTVHTKRNLRALEAQASQIGFTAKKEMPTFEHTLLLGHVSMLTDLQFATRKVDSRERKYIITADRDELIRISRGPPQSYVIEGFCLGHEEFVSKIRLVPDTELLISGGGDYWLGVWDWVQYKLLKKLDLRPILNRFTYPDTKQGQIAVSGLWVGRTTEQILVVAIERIPALFVKLISALQKAEDGASDLEGTSIIRLDGCPIDVAWIDNAMVVSQDVRGQHQQRLLAFRFGGSPDDSTHNPENALDACILDKDDELTAALQILNDLPIDEGVSAKSIDELLYSVNVLRKYREGGAPAKNIADDEEEMGSD